MCSPVAMYLEYVSLLRLPAWSTELTQTNLSILREIFVILTQLFLNPKIESVNHKKKLIYIKI